MFENTTLSPRLHESCLRQTIDYVYCVGKALAGKQMGSIQVRWNKPSEGINLTRMEHLSVTQEEQGVEVLFVIMKEPISGGLAAK